MIEIGPFGAFGVNRVGTDRLPFPLSFSVTSAGGSWLVTAAAAQAAEVADLLAGAMGDTVAVVGLESNSFLHDDYEPWRPSLIAAAQGIDCAVHPLGEWASGTCGLAEEFVVMDRELLPRFLDGTWSPYNLSLIDTAAKPTPDELDEIGLLLGTAEPGEPVLDRLPGARLWFSGHDDCYLAVETCDASVPAALFGRLLALMAGSALADPATDRHVRLPEPGPWLPERLIAESAHWIGTLDSASDVGVAIRLADVARPWRLGERFPESARYVVTLDLLRDERDAWSIAACVSR